MNERSVHTRAHRPRKGRRKLTIIRLRPRILLFLSPCSDRRRRWWSQVGFAKLTNTIKEAAICRIFFFYEACDDDTRYYDDVCFVFLGQQSRDQGVDLNQVWYGCWAVRIASQHTSHSTIVLAMLTFSLDWNLSIDDDDVWHDEEVKLEIINDAGFSVLMNKKRLVYWETSAAWLIPNPRKK